MVTLNHMDAMREFSRGNAQILEQVDYVYQLLNQVSECDGAVLSLIRRNARYSFLYCFKYFKMTMFWKTATKIFQILNDFYLFFLKT